MSWEFVPQWWCRNRHVQSTVGTVARRISNVPEWESLVIPVDQTILRGRLWRTPESRSIVILYHGLGGTSDSTYIIGAGLALRAAGHSVLRMNLRGTDPEHPVTPDLSHSGFFEDFGTVVAWARREGFERVFIAGFSLSANMILNWLSKEERDVDRALVVAPPVNLGLCASLVDAPRNKIYQSYFLKKLRRQLMEKALKYPERLSSVVRPENFKSIRILDDNITAPLYGFNGNEDYYTQCSSAPHLSKIKNDTIIVHATDDPFVDAADLIAYAPRAPKNVHVQLFSVGGHAGFYEGRGQGYLVDRWLAEAFD